QAQDRQGRCAHKACCGHGQKGQADGHSFQRDQSPEQGQGEEAEAEAEAEAEGPETACRAYEET
ncbi:hypothetical protein EV179_006414, partial [Coemansia sp. RSA 487]